MKYSSGIIRRMDDLGQVVIPKDIRKKCGINEGAPHWKCLYKIIA